MKTLLTLSAAATLAFAAPAFATTPAATTTTPSASQQCKQERTAMGAKTFADTYGTNANKRNAFGKCVSKRSARTEQAAETAKTNASKECKAERAADPAAFAKKYGTGKKGANAHGKCVSSKAKAGTAAAVKAQVKAEINAARACRTERSADEKAFAAKYGTNANRRNAFGKCVSAKAKAAPQPAPAQS